MQFPLKKSIYEAKIILTQYQQTLNYMVNPPVINNVVNSIVLGMLLFLITYKIYAINILQIVFDCIIITICSGNVVI